MFSAPEAGSRRWLSRLSEANALEGRLRHPTRRGLLLEFCQEPAGKGSAKNRLHLDVRLEADDDPDTVAVGITGRGGRKLDPDWGELPWRIYADPSGNELCVLPTR